MVKANTVWEKFFEHFLVARPDHPESMRIQGMANKHNVPKYQNASQTSAYKLMPLGDLRSGDILIPEEQKDNPYLLTGNLGFQEEHAPLLNMNTGIEEWLPFTTFENRRLKNESRTANVGGQRGYNLQMFPSSDLQSVLQGIYRIAPNAEVLFRSVPTATGLDSGEVNIKLMTSDIADLDSILQFEEVYSLPFLMDPLQPETMRSYSRPTFEAADFQEYFY